MAPGRFLAVFLLQVLWIIPLTAQDSLHDRRVTISDTLCSVESALKIIEQHTGLSFSYNSGLFNKKKIISLAAEEEPLIDVLTRVFNNNTLKFSIIGRHLVVYQSINKPAGVPSSSSDSVLYFEIRGRVFDKGDRQPLPYSSVFLNGKSIGTISNDEGRFVLKLSSVYLNETLSISCIGYKSFSAPVSTLINSTNDYFLKSDVISIQEVIIRKLSPVLLLQSANDKININYPRKPVILTSFYRETVQRGNRYMMVSEAIIENFKSGYNSVASDQVRILKGRKNENLSSNDSVILKLKAGLSTMLLLDVVKNVPDFLTGENLLDYNYRLADMVIEDGKDNYAIEFSPKPSSLTAYYSGRIIIGTRDLAFKWIEFYIRPEQLGQATDLFIVRKPANLKVKMQKASYKVAFRQTGNKYFLHLIQCETEFKIRNKQQLSGSVYNTKLEMAVTDIDTVNVGRFRLNETAKLHEFFAEQIGAYDESFWGEYNFITPDESLEDALIKLSKVQAARKEEEQGDN